MTAEAAPTAAHQPRHARPTVLTRVNDAVSVRIPKPINRAIDLVQEHKLTAAGVAALIGTVIVASKTPSWGAALLCSYAGTVAATLFWRPRLVAARADRDRLESENGRLTEQFRQVDRGDATAPTQQLRTIGDHGEPT